MKTVDVNGNTYPAKYDVCPRCRGEGTHTNPSIDGNGLTASDIDYHMDGDPEFLDNYFSGVYDVACHECDGKRVVLVVDEEMLSTEQMEQLAEDYSEDLADRLMRDAERRFGC